jgi:hypothetical protein
MERRNAVRYRLQIPTVFRWEKSGQRFEGEGTTRDISEKGAYIFSTTRPPFEGEITVEIVNARPEGGKRALLVGNMQVGRIEDGPEERGGVGFSLAGDVFRLESQVRSEK